MQHEPDCELAKKGLETEKQVKLEEIKMMATMLMEAVCEALSKK